MTHGGARPGAGRKSKAEEMGLQALLNEVMPDSDRRKLFVQLKRMANGRSAHKMDAIKLLLGYLYGTPRQSMEVSGDPAAPVRVEVIYADHQPDAAETASRSTADQAGS